MAPQGLHENQEESVVLDGDMAKSYNIVEIFHSVQGEGYRSGIPHVFIRFGVCNLRCEWCDTNFDVYEQKSVAELSLIHI